METRNFLSLVFLGVMVLASCQTFERRRPDANTPQSPTVQPPVAAATSVPPQPIPQDSAGHLAPVGVFLGPGGMRAYAHIGVLRALQKARIPITVIGGTEWGSIVAAVFSNSGKANEAEWEMMKLRKDLLPSQGFLARQVTAKDSQDLYHFLKMVFGERDLEKGALKYMCTASDGDDTFYLEQGKATDQLLKCSVMPPLFSFYDRAGKKWVSAAISPGDWASEMRKLGAEYIIYVDVVSRGSALAKGQYSEEPNVRALWTAVKAISRQQHSFAHLTIEVPLNMDLSDFDHRREAIAAGEKTGSENIEGLLKMLSGSQGARP